MELNAAKPGPIWSCKIGALGTLHLPAGSDAPMRHAVRQMFTSLVGGEPQFIFSGWSAELTEGELALVENRLPCPDKLRAETLGTALAATTRLENTAVAKALAGFALPLKRGEDASIVDAHGRTVLIADPSRDLSDDMANTLADIALAGFDMAGGA